MGLITSFLRDLPIYFLSLPVVLMALSLHEMAHGYAALKLGDPTARNLGRLTLNPIKHIDPFGFICMLFFHVGWAKPVPITTRNFKNPRRDMAITGAAGPVANLFLAVINLVILRVAMIFLTKSFGEEAISFAIADNLGTSFTGSLGFTIASLVVYLLFLGTVLNISLAIFNLIPVPPFDGSRIFYAFLPPKLYFGVMKYERIIMLVMLVLFAFGFLSGPLGWLLDQITNGLFFLVGFKGTEDMGILNCMLNYVEKMLSIPLNL